MARALLSFVVGAAFVGHVYAQDVGPIVHEGIVEAPIAEVWAAFTTSDGLRGWLAPHAEIDLRVGGLMRANYNPQGRLGDPQTIENTILSFEPQRMMSVRVTRPPADFPFPNAVRQMWTVVYFSADGSARTTVREVTLGFGPDKESQQMRAFFTQGNATTLRQLQRYFANREPGTRNSEPGTEEPEPGTGNPEPGPEEPEPGTGNPELRTDLLLSPHRHLQLHRDLAMQLERHLVLA